MIMLINLTLALSVNVTLSLILNLNLALTLPLHPQIIFSIFLSPFYTFDIRIHTSAFYRRPVACAQSQMRKSDNFVNQYHNDTLLQY